MKVALDVERLIADRMEESSALKQALSRDAHFIAAVASAANAITWSLRNGGTVFFFGNGGSAADAQHLAAELAGRYLMDRRPLRGVALSTNSSCLTAIANDYGYDQVFARQLEGLGSPGDVAVAISTSGNSGNVLRAIEVARRHKLISVALTGKNGGELRSLVDHFLCVSCDHTPRIQEVHVMVGHILCEIVEQQLCG